MTPSNETWSVVIVGAGPAGAYLSANLAARGVRTLLLDRARFPRSKLCGGCLAPAGRAVLDRAGFDAENAMRGGQTISRLDLTSGGRPVRLRLPAYRVVDRSAFDASLVETAIRCGAEFRDECTGSLLPDGTILALDERPKSRERSSILRARVVVIADGIKGNSLHRDTRFAWITKARSHVGIGVLAHELPEGCAQDAITMRHGPDGYLGVAPLAGGRADIAAAVTPAWLTANREGAPLPSFARSLGVRLDEKNYTTPVMGSPQLTRRRARVEADGRVFVCGDAAGYIEPFTGEGMSWALTSAERLSPLLDRALEGRYAEGTWSEQFSIERRRRAVLCRAVGAMLRRPGLTGALVGLCGAIPPISIGVSTIIRGMHARQYTPLSGAVTGAE